MVWDSESSLGTADGSARLRGKRAPARAQRVSRNENEKREIPIWKSFHPHPNNPSRKQSHHFIISSQRPHPTPFPNFPENILYMLVPNLPTPTPTKNLTPNICTSYQGLSSTLPTPPLGSEADEARVAMSYHTFTPPLFPRSEGEGREAEQKKRKDRPPTKKPTPNIGVSYQALTSTL